MKALNVAKNSKAEIYFESQLKSQFKSVLYNQPNVWKNILDNTAI